MKTILTILVVILLSSCQKEYTCICDKTTYSYNDTIESQRIYKLNNTKKQMDIICKNDTWIYVNDSIQKVTLNNCQIK